MKSIFLYLANNFGYMLAIVIFTLVMKLICLPIYIARHINTQKIDIIKKNVGYNNFKRKDKKNYRIKKEYIYKECNIKSFKVMFILFLIEFIFIIFVINSFHEIPSQEKYLWFYFKKNDLIVRIIYILAFIVSELFYIKHVDKKNIKIQYFFSSTMVIIFIFVSKYFESYFLIYYILIVVSSIVFKEIMYKKINIYIDKKCLQKIKDYLDIEKVTKEKI